MNSNQVEQKITERIKQIDDSFQKMTYSFPFTEEALLSTKLPDLEKNERKAKYWLLGLQVVFAGFIVLIYLDVKFELEIMTEYVALIACLTVFTWIFDISRIQKIRLLLQEKAHLLALIDKL